MYIYILDSMDPTLHCVRCNILYNFTYRNFILYSVICKYTNLANLDSVIFGNRRLLIDVILELLLIYFSILN